MLLARHRTHRLRRKSKAVKIATLKAIRLGKDRKRFAIVIEHRLRAYYPVSHARQTLGHCSNKKERYMSKGAAKWLRVQGMKARVYRMWRLQTTELAYAMAKPGKVCAALVLVVRHNPIGWVPCRNRRARPEREALNRPGRRVKQVPSLNSAPTQSVVPQQSA
jgi:hypothetical protein